LNREVLKLSHSCGCDPQHPSHREFFRKYVAKKRQEKPAYYLLELTRKCAEVRKGLVPCTLREEDIEIPKVCPIRKTLLETMKHGTPSSPAIVRIDPDKGFVPGNIFVTSWGAAQELREALKPLEPMTEELLGGSELSDPRTPLDAYVLAEEAYGLSQQGSPRVRPRLGELEDAVASLGTASIRTEIFTENAPLDLTLECDKGFGARTL
jgi:hypothetical protein